jgi:hypothetical protein
MKLLRALGLAVIPLGLMAYPASASTPKPVLEGRAVLPVATYAPGPPSGSFFAGQTINGISFPTPTQPVEGFSSVVGGRAPGEYLAMPDNGFGAKANSRDFLIRAYYVEPDFKTANGGTGTVTVKDFIAFRDPTGVIGFPIVNAGGTERLLTGADIDPESLQRAKNGDLWVGDEFGPWVLHFDATGVLLEPPIPVPGDLVQPTVPGNLMSPNNPFLVGPATQPNSRGFEAMSSTPDGKYLYPILEGATVVDPDPRRRFLFEFSMANSGFTGRVWQYHTERPDTLVADMSALDDHRMVVIERDAGRGLTAVFRNVYVVDLRDVGPDGFLVKHQAVDLTAIPDPDLVSLPPIHTGDVRLGDPFGVACESIEAIHVIDGQRLLLGCDNNFPNTGRNPTLADDNEFIVVKVPGLKSLN